MLRRPHIAVLPPSPDMLSLQVLCNISGLINKLNEINYFSHNNNNAAILQSLNDVIRLLKEEINCNIATLSAILRSFDIYESVDDVIQLLTEEADCDIISPLVRRIGIERALTICDELSARDVVTNILLAENHLNKIMDNYIINAHDISYTTWIRLWNIGYNVMIPDMEDYTHALPASIMNNASHNGLFMRTINHCYVEINIYEKRISQSVTNDIIDVCMKDNDTAILLQLYNNVENIDNMIDCDTSKLSYAKNIRSLFSRYITDNNLRACTNLQKLDVTNNHNITTCNRFANTLKILIARNTMIDDDGLNMCKNIKILHASYGNKITTCDPFAHNLIVLYAEGENCKISDRGIACCARLKKLYADDNKKITTCKPFARTLRVVSACNTYSICGITDAGLIGCARLKELFVGHNPNIRSVRGFTLLKKFSCANINTITNDELKMRMFACIVYS